MDKSNHIRNQILPWTDILRLVKTRSIFEPLRPYFLELGSEWPEIKDFNALVGSKYRDFPFQFVDQAVMPPRNRRKRGSKDGSLASYISSAATRHEIATRRHSVHDLFNFLTYLVFPKSKTAIMTLHASEMISHMNLEPMGKTGGRGRTRFQDLLTMFDEGGALSAPEVFPKMIVFGHGIYEQFIIQPRTIRAFTWHSKDHKAAIGEDNREANGEANGEANVESSNPLSEGGLNFNALAVLDQALSQSLLARSNIDDPKVFSGMYLPPEWTHS
ncbi:MAG: DUF3025 domain-containing protein [Proteobacteria bacterium]|nr:DUF3025 domain-containing protein [Pseudomonadota bacterium]